jgi:hypothetical protein
LSLAPSARLFTSSAIIGPFFANAIYISDIASATADFVLKAMAIAAVVVVAAMGIAKRSSGK